MVWTVLRRRLGRVLVVALVLLVGVGLAAGSRQDHARAGAALPGHLLTGYWQDFVNGARPLRLREVPSSYDVVAVAFASTDPATPGGVTFSLDSGLSAALGGYADADFMADIQTLHGQGRAVILSVGGQDGTVSVGDATSAGNFARSVHGLMTRYGFDGVDIDLENGINPGFMSSA